MKQYIMKYALLFVGIVCLLCGCKKEQTTEITFQELTYYPQKNISEGTIISLKESETSVLTSMEYIADNGKFFFDYEENLLKFEDWENGELYPLCAKVNCTHDSKECNAWFSQESITPTALYYDGTYLYFQITGGGETAFYRQNLDGSNRKQLFVEQNESEGKVIYEGEYVYYVTISDLEDEEREEQEGSMESLTSLRYCLNKGKLTTGETRQLSYHWDVTIGSVSLLGKYENKLALRHSVQTGEKEKNGRPLCEEILFLLDLDTGEMTGIGEGITLRSDGFTVEAIPKGILGTIWLDLESEKSENGYEYYLATIKIDSFIEQYSYRLSMQVWGTWEPVILDNQVFYHIFDEENELFKMAAYDLETGKQRVFSSEFCDFHILGETEHWFYGSLYKADDTYQRVHIRKSDFYAEIPNFIVDIKQ